MRRLRMKKDKRITQMNIYSRICRVAFAVVVAFLLTIVLPYTSVEAADINPAASGSITMTINEDELYVEGATFHLYQVATIDQNLNFTLTEDFAGSNVDVKPISLTSNSQATADKWMSIAADLQSYAQKHNLTALQSRQMSDRKAVFRNLGVGLYLVTGDTATEGNKTVTYQPVVICLPQGGSADNRSWHYDIVSQVKSANATYNNEPNNPNNPTNPDNPTSPNNSTTPGGSTTPGISRNTPGAGNGGTTGGFSSLLNRVQTGDTGHIIMWIGIMCAAAAVIVAIIIRTHRRKSS